MIRHRCWTVQPCHPLREYHISPELVVDSGLAFGFFVIQNPQRRVPVDVEEFVEGQGLGVFAGTSFVNGVGTGEFGFDQDQVPAWQMQGDVGFGLRTLDGQMALETLAGGDQ